MDEFDLIAKYLRPLARDFEGAFDLGDDTARFAPPAGCDLVVTSDALIAGVHFLPDDPPELIARKALRVNLSDLAAAGADPIAYQLMVAWPKGVEEAFVERFCAGLKADQNEFLISLSGGDTTTTSGPFTVAITAFGFAPKGEAHGRAGAEAGDCIFVTGTIGDGALGLRALRGELPGVDEADRAHFEDRYHLPLPRGEAGMGLLGVASACMDVSDGLVGDLEHIAKRSGVMATIEVGRIPFSDAAKRAIAADPSLLEVALTGGDDYELLFTAPVRARKQILEFAKHLDHAVTEIGRIERGSGVLVLRGEEPMRFAKGGWRHGA